MSLITGVVKFVRLFLEFIGYITCGLRGYFTRPRKLPPITNPLLLESASSLAAKILKQEITSEEVVKAFITRIEDVNPILNAVVDQRFAQAIEEAKEVDFMIQNGSIDKENISETKPYLGVPFTTKDCFKVKGLRQTAGLWKRRDFIPDDYANCVQLMIDAGGIILCVTNVSELCMWWESSNYVYGRTNNPYDTRCTVGGSSGGEGCILAACGSPIGIGSDIGGSIRMPSFFNGVFGHKPSSGIVNNSGQEPAAVGKLDVYLTTGPMCKNACDLIPMYKVLAASNTKLLTLDKKVPLNTLKIYYMEDLGNESFTTPVEPELKECIHRVIDHFKTSYQIEAKKIDIKRLKFAPSIFMSELSSEEKANTFCKELDMREGEINVWVEYLKALFCMGKHTFPALHLGIVEKFNRLSHKHPAFQKSLEAGDKIREEFEEILGSDGVFLFPPHPTVAPYHSMPVFRVFNFAYTAIFNILKFPVTHCPMGLGKKGLPLGVQVVANHKMDHLTLAMALEIEKKFGGWVCPSEVV